MVKTENNNRQTKRMEQTHHFRHHEINGRILYAKRTNCVCVCLRLNNNIVRVHLFIHLLLLKISTRKRNVRMKFRKYASILAFELTPKANAFNNTHNFRLQIRMQPSICVVPVRFQEYF